MTYFDSGVIALYLIVTIGVGIFAGTGVKTMSEFAVGKKDFMTLTLVMTIFATYVDGEMILNDTMNFYKSGTGYLLPLLSMPISMFIYSFLASKVTRFKDAISVGDIIGNLYGEKAKMFTGISGLLISASFVGAQFKALSFIFDYFYGIDNVSGIFLSSVILITYSAFGGVRAVTWTDTVQFFILMCAIPIVTSVAVGKQGGVIEIFHKLPANKLTIFPEDKITAFKYLAYFIAVAVPLCSPPMIQRMLMTKDSEKSKNAYWIAAMISFPIILIECLSGISANLYQTNVDPNNIFLYLIDVSMPSGLKGFAVAGIIAVIMSTADSFMNTAAISFSHDFYKTFRKDQISDNQELIMTKVTTLVVGIGACFLALRFDNLLDMMLYSYLLWGPVVTVPLLVGLFDIKASKESFYISMIAGVATAFLWIYFDLEQKTYIHELIPAMGANALVFLFGVITAKKS